MRREHKYQQRKKMNSSDQVQIIHNSELFDLINDGSVSDKTIKKLRDLGKSENENLMKKLFTDITKNNIKVQEKAFYNAHKILTLMNKEKLPPILMENFLKVLRNFKGVYNSLVNQKALILLLDYVHLRLKPLYIDTFQLLIHEDKCKQVMHDLLKNRYYFEYCKLIKSVKVLQKQKKFYADILMKKAQKQNDQDVLKYMNCLGICQYPEIQEKFLIDSMFQFYKTKGWHYCEEIFALYPKVLSIMISHMLQPRQKMKGQAISICKRNMKIIEYLRYPQKMYHCIEEQHKAIPNPLHNNIFGPSNPEKYFSFSDFGLMEKDIIFIDKSTPHIENYLEDITSSSEIGIDTESIVARTDLSKPLNLLALIQVATEKRVYLLDPKNIDKQITNYYFSQYFNNKNKKIIGHTIKFDFQVTAKALGYYKEVSCEIIEIKDNFRFIFPQQRKGLQNISEQVLGKPICKEFTLTDWSRRPLFKNQAHYAAMDAFIVLKINKKQNEMIKKRK